MAQQAHKHEYSSYRTVAEDAWGVKTRRQYYCDWCGEDRPRRVATHAVAEAERIVSDAAIGRCSHGALMGWCTFGC